MREGQADNQTMRADSLETAGADLLVDTLHVGALQRPATVLETLEGAPMDQGKDISRKTQQIRIGKEASRQSRQKMMPQSLSSLTTESRDLPQGAEGGELRWRRVVDTGVVMKPEGTLQKATVVGAVAMHGQEAHSDRAGKVLHLQHRQGRSRESRQ